MWMGSTPPSLKLPFNSCCVQKDHLKITRISSLTNAENVTDATKLSRGVGLGNACQYSQDKNICETSQV